MSGNMRVVIIEPNEPARIAEIGSGLNDMQEVVGGFIEIVPAAWMLGGAVLKNKGLLIVMNEEGKLQGLKINFPIQSGLDYIFGTAFICRGQEDFMGGLSEEEASLVVNLFNKTRKDRPAATGTASSKTIYGQSTNHDSNCQDTEGGV